MSSPHKPERSLQTMLSLWFLFFTMVPLAFITGYSLVIYEKSMQSELLKRVETNTQQIIDNIKEFENYLKTNSKQQAADPSFVFHLSTNAIPNARNIVKGWLRGVTADRISVFDRSGHLVIATYKAKAGEIMTASELESADVYLEEKLLEKIESQESTALFSISKEVGLELVVYTKVLGRDNKTAGYVEESVVFNNTYFQALKSKFNLDIILLDKELTPKVASHLDLLEVPKEFFQKNISGDAKTTFTMNTKGHPYTFQVQPIELGGENKYLAVGASTQEATAVLKRVTIALLSVVAGLVMLLIPLLVLISNTVVKPIRQLVEATQRVASGAAAQSVTENNRTEIGVLTRNFNRMAQTVVESRTLLEQKVSELEIANRELKEAQSQLVQSAKMVSLGHLVAGIAHELNNPIGFMSSNVEHLKTYSNQLFDLIKILEKSPDKATAKKAEMDYEYIQKDLPRILESCEEGARRTKEIVMGLRNFSRIEEGTESEFDIHEGLNSTLGLLAGEIRNRIQIHEDYGKIPKIKCHASQMNQVFMNILSNAAQAIEGKGDIWISTRQMGDHVEIKIKDNGKGMTEEVKAKIFDPFFTTKDVGKGTGLGLSISFGIIQRHGGEILVESSPQKGTEFRIKVPGHLPRSGSSDSFSS